MVKIDNQQLKELKISAYKLYKTKDYRQIKAHIMREILSSVSKNTSERDIAFMAGQKYVFELIERYSKELEKDEPFETQAGTYIEI